MITHSLTSACALRRAAFTTLLVAAHAAIAGGIDRSQQNISPLFESGTYAELSVRAASPVTRGRDIASRETGDVLGNYVTGGLAFKQDVNKHLSYVAVLDESIGADLQYPSEQGSGSALLGGTSAHLRSQEVKGLLRYKFDDTFSLHGGLRIESVRADISLLGEAYGPISGYRVAFDRNTEPGYVIGFAAEKPEIALHFAVTYDSQIVHRLDTSESISPGTGRTTIATPQSVNVSLQSDVARNTLVFAQLRWVEWSRFRVTPPALGSLTNGASLADFPNTTTYSLGTAYKFSPSFTGMGLMSIEGREGATPSLAVEPYKGNKTLGLGVVYNANKYRLTTLLSYSKLGDTDVGVGGDAPVGAFHNGHVLGLGMKLGMEF